MTRRPVSKAQEEAYDRLLATNPDIEKKGKNMLYTSVDGHMFTLFSSEAVLGIRLAKPDREAFLRDFDTTLLPSHGAVMREYVAIPDDLLADTHTLKPYLHRGSRACPRERHRPRPTQEPEARGRRSDGDYSIPQKRRAPVSEGVNKFVERRKASPAGAGHYHLADPYPYQMRVSIAGQQVALSRDALVLKEVGTSLYNPSFYVPAGDVDLALFEREEGYTTHCPIKGEATYWHYKGPDRSIDRAAWSYEAPLDYSEMIAGHFGFDQRFATIEFSPSN